MVSSEAEENGGGAIAAEAGRWAAFVTGGRNVTGAVAALMLIKPGVKGRAVLLRTLLADNSGNGVSAGGAGLVRIVTEAVAGLGATGGDGITMEVVLTVEYDRSPLDIPWTATGSKA